MIAPTVADPFHPRREYPLRLTWRCESLDLERVTGPEPVAKGPRELPVFEYSIRAKPNPEVSSEPSERRVMKDPESEGLLLASGIITPEGVGGALMQTVRFVRFVTHFSVLMRC